MGQATLVGLHSSQAQISGTGQKMEQELLGPALMASKPLTQSERESTAVAMSLKFLS